MRICVLLPSHDKPRYAAESIDSLLRQTYPDWHCCILDSGKLYDQGYYSNLHDPRITVHRLDETPDLCRTKNMASWAHNEAHRNGWIPDDCQLISYLCDDDLLYPTALESFVQFFQDHPEAMACYGNEKYQGGPWGSTYTRSCGPVLRTGFIGVVDYLQLCHRRELLGKVWWPEEAIHRNHADGLFMERIGAITPIHPLGEDSPPLGINRRTPQSLMSNPNVQPRPCVCDKTATCRICWLYHNDERYHHLWGGDGTDKRPGYFTLGTKFAIAFAKHAVSGFAAPSEDEVRRRKAHCNACPFLIGEKCSKCGCHTPTKQMWLTQACPVSRWERKTLLYHIYPRDHNGMWQWNVDELKKRKSLFDRVIVSVATGIGCDPPEMVFERLGDCERLTVANGPLQEMASWDGLWNAAQGETGFIMYAHAKGVSKCAAFPAERFWAALMWETLVDHWSAARQMLHEFKIIGSLKRGGGVHPHSAWHYPGSYYWVRAEDGLDRCKKVWYGWTGTEGWPGYAFAPDEGGNLFDVYGSNAYNFYDGCFMDQVSKTSLPEWKQANVAHRSV